MDDASIPLEKKWDAIAKQMNSKEEFRCAFTYASTLLTFALLACSCISHARILDNFRQNSQIRQSFLLLDLSDLGDASLRWWCAVAERAVYALEGHQQGIDKMCPQVRFEGGRYLS